MENMIAIVVGVLIATSVILALQTIPLTTAHTETGGDSMGCMSGMMTASEMDKNNDGICDMCGMQVSQCAQMASAMKQHMQSGMGHMMGQGMGHMMESQNSGHMSGMPCHE
jgi:hypothetical protein